MLLGVGLAFGYAMANYYYSGARPLEATLIFHAAFGLVHVPAAIILFIKRRRMEAPTPLPGQVRDTPAAAADHRYHQV
jgi:hypothetical protein